MNSWVRVRPSCLRLRRNSNQLAVSFFIPSAAPINFAVAIFVDSHGDQYGRIHIFSAPVALEIDSVYLDVGVLALQVAITPSLYMAAYFLSSISTCAYRNIGSSFRSKKIKTNKLLRNYLPAERFCAFLP